MEIVKTWTDDKEEFITSIKDGEYIITVDNELVDETLKESYEYYDDEKTSFIIADLAPYHTTD